LLATGVAIAPNVELQTALGGIAQPIPSGNSNDEMGYRSSTCSDQMLLRRLIS
jgi:hypothetical protein